MISTISGEPVFNAIKMIAPPLPFSGTLSIYLGRYHSMHEINDSAWIITGIAYAGIRCYFTSDNQIYPSGCETLAEFSNSTEPGTLPDIEPIACDAPDVPNAAIMFTRILKYSDGTPIYK
jgi:hypothetical protein